MHFNQEFNYTKLITPENFYSFYINKKIKKEKEN